MLGLLKTGGSYDEIDGAHIRWVQKVMPVSKETDREIREALLRIREAIDNNRFDV